MKKYVSILLSLTALLGMVSCEGYLDKKPLSDIAGDNYFRNETDLQLFSNSFYDIFDQTCYRHQSDQYMEETFSDDMRGGNNRSAATVTGWTWTTLRKMNTLLGNLDQCEDEAARVKYEAITRFFRAYFYSEKLKRFGDVPWIDHELFSTDEELQAPRDSREVIMGHILEDLDFAAENLAATKNGNVYRVSRWAALALKSNICLFEGTFRKYHAQDTYAQFFSGAEHDYKYYLEESVKAAEALMASGFYKLYTTGKPASDYADFFVKLDADTNENILAINFDYALAVKHNATWYGLMQTAGRMGYNKKIIDSYLMADGTRFTDQPGWQIMIFNDEMKDRDPRLAQTVRTPGWKRPGTNVLAAPDFGCSITGYQTVKFVQSAADVGADSYDGSYCDLPVFRYAEVLLNYAEAKAELDAITASDLEKSIDLIRARVGMPALSTQLADVNANPDPYLASSETGYPKVTGNNKGIILEIRRERTIELAQEGTRRWYDLMRWAEGKALEQSTLGMYFPGEGFYDLDGDGTDDLCLYLDSKPQEAASMKAYQIGVNLILSEGDKGYVKVDNDINHVRVFDESRDYLYPIPSNERQLNHNLTQNPGWDDGLNF